MNIFKRLLFGVAPYVPHTCQFECVGYCSHYGMNTEIANSVASPTHHHYPSTEIQKDWLSKGFKYARVFQSHWQCACGKNQVFFFLNHPKVNLQDASWNTISTEEYGKMVKHNPFNLGSSRGTNMAETLDELNKGCGF